MELLRSYTEITPKLWDWDYGRGTMELLRSYTEITPKLRTVELWNYSEVIVACYSPLLVLVCWSVSQDPPRPIEDITVAFGLL